jgi:hypothetical protein
MTRSALLTLMPPVDPRPLAFAVCAIALAISRVMVAAGLSVRSET